jgi:hypothetical protein
MFWRSTEKQIPLLGVRGAGKTYFLLSLGYLVSKRGWGQVVGSEGSIYLEELLPYVSKGKQIPPTQGNYPVEIQVTKVGTISNRAKFDFTISTQDFSGGKFENAMEQVTTDVSFADGPSAEFYDLYRSSDGLIVVVDLVRGASRSAFRANPESQILDALSEQVVPLAKGLELLLDANRSVAAKPIFLVFTKSDIHQLSIEEISEYFDRLMAIPLRRLEQKGCEISKYTTSAVGWADTEDETDALENLEGQGFSDILTEMAFQFE